MSAPNIETFGMERRKKVSVAVDRDLKELMLSEATASNCQPSDVIRGWAQAYYSRRYTTMLSSNVRHSWRGLLDPAIHRVPMTSVQIALVRKLRQFEVTGISVDLGDLHAWEDRPEVKPALAAMQRLLKAKETMPDPYITYPLRAFIFGHLVTSQAESLLWVYTLGLISSQNNVVVNTQNFIDAFKLHLPTPEGYLLAWSMQRSETEGMPPINFLDSPEDWFPWIQNR